MISSLEIEKERKLHNNLTEQMSHMASLLKGTALQMNAEVLMQNKVSIKCFSYFETA